MLATLLITLLVGVVVTTVLLLSVGHRLRTASMGRSVVAVVVTAVVSGEVGAALAVAGQPFTFRGLPRHPARLRRLRRLRRRGSLRFTGRCAGTDVRGCGSRPGDASHVTVDHQNVHHDDVDRPERDRSVTDPAARRLTSAAEPVHDHDGHVAHDDDADHSSGRDDDHDGALHDPCARRTAGHPGGHDDDHRPAGRCRGADLAA